MFWLERTELLVKPEGLAKLQKAHVLIVGLGGVGSYAAEFVARAGVGSLTIVDADTVSLTNINRQLPALHSTIGQEKTAVMAARLRDINPDLNLTVLAEFLSPERAWELITPAYDYVIDCIDSLTPKLKLILAAKRKKVKLVSCMGAGGALDPSQIKVADLMKTYNCPLAKSIRKRLKNERIHSGIKAVFSAEIVSKETMQRTEGLDYKKSFYGTISFMPAAFGLHAAATVINYLLKN
jgi:UBA/THIF-type NAD/FAD binding protein